MDQNFEGVPIMKFLNKTIVNVELSKFSISDLWAEIGRRLNLKFGKVQMSFHNGKPSDYANLDMRVKTDELSENDIALN
jgi:hypothetical protein